MNKPTVSRELSWLRFNQRVLELARDSATKLLEQAKFSAIFSNNLDEFFMVRVASLKSQAEAELELQSDSGRKALAQLDAIHEQLLPLLEEQQHHLQEQLKPQLANQGVLLLNYQDLTRRQKDWVQSYFLTHISPTLRPRVVGPNTPWPFISSLSLNIVALISKPGSHCQQLARVKVPTRRCPRFIQIPAELHGGRQPEPVAMLIPQEQLIAINLGRLIPGARIHACHLFRVTRDADLELEEQDGDDLLEALKEGLRKRSTGGEVVRLEIDHSMPQGMAMDLMHKMHLKPTDLYAVKGLLAAGDLLELMRLRVPDLKDKPWHGVTPKPLRRAQQSQLEDGSLNPNTFESIFAVLRRGDVLLHHPFDLFATSVEEFINQAADDASVLAIKMTLYRVSKDSPIIKALIRAAENGKQVMALVELKARFDEDNNIQWARQLERSGVHVVYGVLGLKTHTKITLVVRKEKERLRSYCHIATGNYNSKTATLYTDLGLLSARPELGQDLAELFNYLTGFSKQQNFRRLLVAPVTLRRSMEALIERETQHALEGRTAHIKAKMNALVDPRIIALLYRASQAGVQIDLVVRGMCSLRPGVAGVSDNIRVSSVIGRFLEHSRLFWFANGGEQEMYIGSADWMGRNLDRRVEAVAPIEDPHLRQQLERLIDSYLDDNCTAWDMQSDGSFVQRMPEQDGYAVQAALIDGWRTGLKRTTPTL